MNDSVFQEWEHDNDLEAEIIETTIAKRRKSIIELLESLDSVPIVQKRDSLAIIFVFSLNGETRAIGCGDSDITLKALQNSISALLKVSGNATW